jgi:hypothetical protein
MANVRICYAEETPILWALRSCNDMQQHVLEKYYIFLCDILHNDRWHPSECEDFSSTVGLMAITNSLNGYTHHV